MAQPGLVTTTPSIFTEHRADIEEEMRQILSPYSGEVYKMLKYHLGWVKPNGAPDSSNSGKMIRPSLCLHAYHAVTGRWKEALPAAAALELVHNFSLIHDDIQDHDKERRHRKTVWAIWGESQGINTGDAMAFLSNVAMSSLWDTAITHNKIRRAYQLFNTATLEMIEGQTMDLIFERRAEVGPQEYMSMISKKTGALLRCSLELGATLGSDDTKTIESFRKAGENVGLAFQIKDDMLGIWGDEKLTGKPFASDVHRKKKSLPVVIALAGPGGRHLKSIYSKKRLSGRDVRQVLNIMDENGVEAICRAKLDNSCSDAQKNIARVNVHGKARESFEQMLSFLMERGY